MQEFVNAMVRFSAALTLYSLQQVRSAVTAAVDQPMSLKRMSEALDSAANSLSSQIDESQKTTLNSVTTMGSDVVSRTYDAVKNAVSDPGQVLKATGDVLRKTTETCAAALKGTTGPAPASGEPQAAADVLAG